jgi:DNA-binding transcriptional MerR regulator
MAPQGVVSVKSPEAFRTISEVAAMLDVPQHVLRFWETRFSQIKPIKRAGGRRFYRPEDVDLLRGIQMLLYFEGYTIRGAQKILREKGVRYTAALGREQTKNGHAVAEVVEEITNSFEEGSFGAFEQAEETAENGMEVRDLVAPAPETHENDPEAGHEESPASSPALKLVMRTAGALPGATLRQAKLEAIRAELLELKSRLAAARQGK